MATTATRKRSTRKSAANDKPVVTPRRRPAAATVKPAATKRTAKKPARPDQDSVTITMQRGKRDRQSREIIAHEPTAGGGVRFEEIADNGASPVYLSQEQDAKLGKPQTIRVTVKRLA
jgi:hypothetical protein